MVYDQNIKLNKKKIIEENFPKNKLGGAEWIIEKTLSIIVAP